MGTRCSDHVTPLYPQKLALTSPTGSVGIVRVRTKATEFSFSLVSLMYELKKMERYLRVNLLGPGPRLMKKEFTGPRSHKG